MNLLLFCHASLGLPHKHVLVHSGISSIQQQWDQIGAALSNIPDYDTVHILDLSSYRQFLVKFAKLQKVTFSFNMSITQPVRLQGTTRPIGQIITKFDI